MKEKSVVFYPRIAFSGIRRNLKIYAPFCLAASGLVMMFYIAVCLAMNEPLREVLEMMSVVLTDYSVSTVLNLSWIVLGAFSAAYLLYAGSFLIKSRRAEFGMYNILGMGKQNIMKVLIWENLMLFAASFGFGILLGIVFCKLALIIFVTLVGSGAESEYETYQVPMSVIGGDGTLGFSVNGLAVVYALCVFFAVFGMILVSSMRQVRINNAVRLFRSARVGEKPPKANAAAAVSGAVLLAAGYILENTVKDPAWELPAFFGAMLLIMAATYLLFSAGSVAVCSMLKKNRKYYYSAKHFVSVSQMSYRMRKNGAGLASICVAVTAALVMLSSASGLYFGYDRLTDRRFRRDLINGVQTKDAGFVERYVKNVEETAEKYGAAVSDTTICRSFAPGKVRGYYRGKKLAAAFTALSADGMFTEEEMDVFHSGLASVYFCYVPISDYNAAMGTELEVNRGEALILRTFDERRDEMYDLIPILGDEYTEELTDRNGVSQTVTFCAAAYLKPAGTVDHFIAAKAEHLEKANSDNTKLGFVTRYVFINDEDFAEQYKKRLETSRPWYSESRDMWYEPAELTYYVGMDLDCSTEILHSISVEASRKTYAEPEVIREEDGKRFVQWQSVGGTGEIRPEERYRSYYGCLFYAGVMFSVIFSAAAVLIMYYKQVSEGHEDRERFKILKKVGMTDGEIRRTINSQTMTMFFMPLLAAAMHTVFTAGAVFRHFSLIGFVSGGFLRVMTACCFGAFGVLYTAAYKLTSRAYYRVVSK